MPLELQCTEVPIGFFLQRAVRSTVPSCVADERSSATTGQAVVSSAFQPRRREVSFYVWVSAGALWFDAGRAVFPLVFVIVRAGVPAQVRQYVVGLVAVVVAPFHSCGAWPAERAQHEDVHEPVHTAALVRHERDLSVPLGMRSVPDRLTVQPTSSGQGAILAPHVAAVAHFVRGNFVDRAPRLHRVSVAGSARTCP